VPVGGSGGVALDASPDTATGGSGGATGGARTAGSVRTGGASTGGTSGTGGSGSGGATSPACAGRPPSDAGDGGSTLGLVAYYPCDLATGTTLPDQSGNGKNGTLVTRTGGTASHAFGPGQVGNAFDFVVASKGYATQAAGLVANVCEATVAAWVYVNSSVNWQRIFAFGKDQNVYLFLTSGNSTTSNLRFAISIGGNSAAAEQIIDGTAALPTGVWHHVAVVLGPSGGILPLDGARVGTNATVTLRPAGLADPPNYHIGKSQFNSDPRFDGNIDELRVYDRALSPTELQALASAS
jgi:hypothetical protein